VIGSHVSVVGPQQPPLEPQHEAGAVPSLTLRAIWPYFSRTTAATSACPPCVDVGVIALLPSRKVDVLLK
jgi:hypothetical protein